MNDHELRHNSLISLWRSKGWDEFVKFVPRNEVEKGSLQRLCAPNANHPYYVLDLDPLLHEVTEKLDRQMREPSVADTAERWSPIWIDTEIDTLLTERPDGYLKELENIRNHLRDLNGVHTSNASAVSDSLEGDYIKRRDDYFRMRDKYRLSPQSIIYNIIHTTPHLGISSPPSGELAVEREFGVYIMMLRLDELAHFTS